VKTFNWPAASRRMDTSKFGREAALASQLAQRPLDIEAL
jgi:hypothetical protein